MTSNAEKRFEPAPVLVLKTGEQAKAYLHKTRLKILKILVDQPRTITQIAKDLSIHPANLTRHFRRLESAGLIHIVEKRDIGRTVEKYYRAVARSFDVLPEAGSVEKPVAKVLGILRHDLTCAIRQLPEEGEEPPALGLIMRAHLSEAQFRQFTDKMQNLIEEFKVADGPSGREFTMNVSLYTGGVDYGPTGEVRITRK